MNALNNDHIATVQSNLGPSSFYMNHIINAVWYEGLKKLQSCANFELSKNQWTTISR